MVLNGFGLRSKYLKKNHLYSMVGVMVKTCYNGDLLD